ncbi:protein of unknown function [Flaviramulus basaltis]|uniref:DUF4252 domain-containing protein n=1 Tax=Flaviramulus basaltis TaxID=369401 RepID=A0A1K2IJK5_9FLAO|nr:DUF4252 domain-containing protein [Flaviramulus basaltis]SFZ92478.1 protein of unknown function [Flaviramulus basaltis]
MKRTIQYIIYTFFATVILISCGDGLSLQRYYVDNQEVKNFITQDIPLSMIEIDKDSFTEEQKEAYKSVNKLNFLGYKSNETNLEAFNAEIAKVKIILSDSKYVDLVEFSDKGNKVIVKYIGDDDEADEIVVFGSSKEMGFGIVRILGNDMNPEKMVTLIDAFQKSNIGESQVQDIMNFFK